MAVTFAGGYVPVTHLAPIDTYEADFVAVAERFLGVPYLWGGKTALGLDCSGLVQIALSACGIFCPRDSDMQERALGAPVAVTEDGADLRRGDLVFWKGHVAIVRDDENLLHANAFHMAVADRADRRRHRSHPRRRERDHQRAAAGAVAEHEVLVDAPSSSLRGAQRRSNPESAAVTLDCFASLAMTNDELPTKAVGMRWPFRRYAWPPCIFRPATQVSLTLMFMIASGSTL